MNQPNALVTHKAPPQGAVHTRWNLCRTSLCRERRMHDLYVLARLSEYDTMTDT